MNRRFKRTLLTAAAFLTSACIGVMIFSYVRADDEDSEDEGRSRRVRSSRDAGSFFERAGRGEDDPNKADHYYSDYTIDVLGAPSDYRTKLDTLMENEPAAADFVAQYPTMYGTYDEMPLTSTYDESTYGVPLLMQWDTRWGFKVYGSNAMGFTGCGPTCLSMVASYLYNDPTLTPGFMADYSIENGYCIPGSGTSWALMSDGAMGLGLDVTEIPLDEERVIANLEVGNPIIMIMGPGEFTSEGHFVVLCGYENGYYKINDPYSVVRSERSWTWDEFSDQIQDMWVYRLL